MTIWAAAPLVAVVVLALVVLAQWCGSLQRKVNKLSERMAWLEGHMRDPD